MNLSYRNQSIGFYIRGTLADKGFKSNKIVVIPFYVTGLFLHTLKMLENVCFSNIFKGYRKRPVTWNW